MPLGERFGVVVFSLLFGLQSGLAQTGTAAAGAVAPLKSTAPVAGNPPAADKSPTRADRPLLQLGPGDQVTMQVYNRPEMDSAMYVADDGTIRVPLAGSVQVAGLSPGEAAQKVEAALRSGRFLVDPHVTFTVSQSRSQRVSVLGEVHTPGRYPIESNTTILDVVAQAGGTTEKSADVIYVLRADSAGNLRRYPVNLKGIVDVKDATPAVLLTLQGGDSIYVPPAEQFYIAGEVHAPAMYRLESGMTLLQAIARAGGVTERGSARRVEIKRRGPKGEYAVISAKPTEKIQPDDVITVKERIF
jgi:polysaccharide export outer membrane protein